MLSEEDKKFIEQHAYLYDHEYLYYSIILGEPYLIGECLCLFDGETLYINGHNLERHEMAVEKIKKILSSQPEFKKANYVWYWGASQIKDASIAGFHMKDFSEPSELDADRIVSLKEFDMKNLPKASRDLRRAESNGLKMEVAHDKIFSHEHIRLMTEFMKTHDVPLPQLGFIDGLRVYAAYDHVRIYNVINGDVLAGFGVVSELFKGRSIFLEGFFDRKVVGSSDILYHKIIQDAKHRGANYMSLGYCVGTQGLHDFKVKWGATTSGPPYYQHIFYREGCAEPDIGKRFLQWSEKLIQERLLKC
ncbi:MAG: hypothetical protein HY518_01720 [Candidatus Aenigmarchaeota archaeon]|nr:hypothetical protein [Candidatus Aenigmarchaeota archaeon]